MRTAAVYQSFFCHCRGICRFALTSVYGIYKYQITGEIADSFPVIRIFLFISQTVTPLGSLARILTYLASILNLIMTESWQDVLLASISIFFSLSSLQGLIIHSYLPAKYYYNGLFFLCP